MTQVNQYKSLWETWVEIHSTLGVIGDSSVVSHASLGLQTDSKMEIG